MNEDANWKTYMPSPGEGCDLPYITSESVAGHGLDYLVHERVSFYGFTARRPTPPGFSFEPAHTVPAPGGFVISLMLLGCIILRRTRRVRVH